MVQTHIGHLDVVGVETLELAEYDRRADEPTIPELVSAPEAATLLGVKRQRVHQLLTENPGSLNPCCALARGRSGRLMRFVVLTNSGNASPVQPATGRQSSRNRPSPGHVSRFLSLSAPGFCATSPGPTAVWSVGTCSTLADLPVRRESGAVIPQGIEG